MTFLLWSSRLFTHHRWSESLALIESRWQEWNFLVTPLRRCEVWTVKVSMSTEATTASISSKRTITLITDTSFFSLCWSLFAACRSKTKNPSRSKGMSVYSLAVTDHPDTECMMHTAEPEHHGCQMKTKMGFMPLLFCADFHYTTPWLIIYIQGQ